MVGWVRSNGCVTSSHCGIVTSSKSMKVLRESLDVSFVLDESSCLQHRPCSMDDREGEAVLHFSLVQCCNMKMAAVKMMSLVREVGVLCIRAIIGFYVQEPWGHSPCFRGLGVRQTD